MYDDNKLKIKVEKQNLLGILKQNRDKHEADYTKAKEGFRKLLRVELQKKLDSLDAGKKVQLTFKNTKPESHLGDYDEVIEMLELSIDSELEITHQQFKMWVKDDWNWKRMWSTSNSVYLSAAGQ